MTLLHLAESLVRAPGKRFVTYEQPSAWTASGNGVPSTTSTRRTARSTTPRVVPEGRDPFAVIVRAMLDAGIGRTGTVGAADSRLFDAGPAVDFGVRWIEEQLNAPG